MLCPPCSCLPRQLAPRVRTRNLASLIRPTRSPLGSTAQLDAALWAQPRPSASTSRLPKPSAASTQGQRRGVCDKQQFRTRHGNIRIDLSSKSAVGIAQSRGERPYQEDAYAVYSLAVPQSSLKWNVVDDRLGTGWTPQTLEGFQCEEPPGKERRRQVAYFGVFDGHGGDRISRYLRDTLASLLEASHVEEIPAIIDEYRSLGGYLKRYRGGPLDRFRKDSPEYSDWKGMALDDLAVLAFLKADCHVCTDADMKRAGGSTATIALLHSLDLPYSHPYYASSLLSLTVAHLGDTSCLLASTQSGRARRLTENHHADSRTESERLRTSGTGIITDSFGESRWGGVIANTRAVGDTEFKPVGVIAEPDITKKVFRGEEFSHLILLSDGITDSLSDQEIVDLTRGIRDPTQAAKKIVSFAEDVGAEDNLTCLVVPLPGFGRMGGMDTTASRREYRLRQMTGASSRQKRM
ncbi:hypothetical protein JCM3774_002054 [Rhodotorula dairenensis]